MTHITFQDGRVVMREGRIGTEAECCCDDCQCKDCYRFDYEWSIAALVCDNPKTFSGTAFIRSVDCTPGNGEIQCYEDPDVLSVDVGIFSGKKMVLNYGELCGVEGQDAQLEFVCDDLFPDGGIVITPTGGGILDVLEFPGRICCGETLGTYSLSNEFQSLTVTISKASDGACDCAGYTPVTPS